MSGIRASSRFTATRSNDSPARPPASPTDSTASKRSPSSTARICRTDSPNRVGNTIVRSAKPGSVKADKAATARSDGLTASPSNGAKPDTRTRRGDWRKDRAPFREGYIR